MNNVRDPLAEAWKMQTERPADDLDVVAELHLRLRRNGAMSLEGAVGDEKLALGMLQGAIEAVKRQHEPEKGIVIPGGDLDV